MLVYRRVTTSDNLTYEIVVWECQEHLQTLTEEKIAFKLEILQFSQLIFNKIDMMKGNILRARVAY